MPQLTKKCQPLLSTVGGNPRTDRKKTVARQMKDSSPPSSSKGFQVNAEPISDEESSGAGQRRSHSQMESSGDSGDDRGMSRGSIRKTEFGSTKGSKDSRHEFGQVTAAAKGNVASINSAKRRRVSDSKDARDRSSSTLQPVESSKRTTTKPPSSSSEHMIDTHGFTKCGNIKKTFGGAAKKTSTKAPSSKEKKDIKVQGKKEVKAPKKPSATGFISFSDDCDSPKKESTFRKLVGSPVVSPSKGPGTKFEGVDTDSESHSPTSKPQLKVLSIEPGAKRKSKKSPDRKAEPEEEEPESQEEFRTFDDVDGMPLSDYMSKSQLSDIDSDDEGAQAKPEEVEETALPSVSVCPWCGLAVEEKLVKDFSKGKRMNVRQQTIFCRQHKKQEAVETWNAKSYPTIDWEELPDRIATHCNFLLDIVNGSPSHYRTKLAEKIGAGQGRSLKKEENLNPGYYGPRGFNLMCDRLVDRFGELLKQKAIHDRVISGRGSAAFIQSVLVAELAVQLIKEDMGVHVEEARGIMEESKTIGDIIHEEV